MLEFCEHKGLSSDAPPKFTTAGSGACAVEPPEISLLSCKKKRGNKNVPARDTIGKQNCRSVRGPGGALKPFWQPFENQVGANSETTFPY